MPPVCPHTLRRDGATGVPVMSGSSAVGGRRYCLDNDDVRYRQRFLKALATRYKDHPATYGYDIWNECNTSGGSLDSPAGLVGAHFE